MGSSASKASRAATGAVSRKYPTRPPPSSQTSTPTAEAFQTTSPSSSRPPTDPTSPGPSVHPPPHASGERDAAIDHDASDPDFAQSLRSLGPVQPNPTLSPSSTFPSRPQQQQRQTPAADPRTNPAVRLLESRARLQERADQEAVEVGRHGRVGREFLDVYTIKRVLVARDQQGRKDEEIERVLGLKKGVVARLGGKGVVGAADEVGRDRKEVDLV